MESLNVIFAILTGVLILLIICVVMTHDILTVKYKIYTLNTLRNKFNINKINMRIIVWKRWYHDVGWNPVMIAIYHDNKFIGFLGSNQGNDSPYLKITDPSYLRNYGYVFNSGLDAKNFLNDLSLD